jgi:hypothetical protein
MAQTPLWQMNNTHAQPDPAVQEVTMSLLQRIDPHQKADHWHPAFRPSGVMNSDVSEVTETDEDILIPKARDAPHFVSDDVLERAPPAWEVITEYVATSFVVAVICVWLALALVNVIFPGEWALLNP